MALKDLIAAKSNLTEEAIEAIIKGYVTFDPDEQEISFMPAAAALSNKAKILIYLVALQGWPIIAPEKSIPTEAKPSELEKHLGIPGGSLRPTLMEMRDRHLVLSRNGAYSIRGNALAAIKAELDGGSAQSRPVGKRPTRRRERPITEEAAGPTKATKAKGRSLGRKRSQSALFDSWITEGWFDEGRTLSDVHARFRREGIIIPQTSLPKFFLRALDNERLTRNEVESSGKKVWVYKARK